MLKAPCALYATPGAIGKTPRATRLKRAFCTAVVKNPRTLLVSAGALLHQRPIRVDLTPQQHYFCVSPDKISSER